MKMIKSCRVAPQGLSPLSFPWVLQSHLVPILHVNSGEINKNCQVLTCSPARPVSPCCSLAPVCPSCPYSLCKQQRNELMTMIKSYRVAPQCLPPLSLPWSLSSHLALVLCVNSREINP